MLIDKIEQEIKKVKRRVPKWFREGETQINSLILFKYLELHKEGKPISRNRLKYECEEFVNFDGNFNQMVNFGEKIMQKYSISSMGKLFYGNLFQNSFCLNMKRLNNSIDFSKEHLSKF